MKKVRKSPKAEIGRSKENCLETTEDEKKHIMGHISIKGEGDMIFKEKKAQKITQFGNNFTARILGKAEPAN